LQDVSEKLKLKSIDVDHLENGRKFYQPEDIEMFLSHYNFAKEDFYSLLSLKVLNKQIVNHIIINKEKKDK
jgi:hypothetical protein